MNTIDYDKLRAASDWADLSPSIEPTEWAPEEGIDSDELMKFSAEQAWRMITSSPIVAMGNQVTTLAFGIVFGARIMNLVHRSENPDLSLDKLTT